MEALRAILLVLAALPTCGSFSCLPALGPRSNLRATLIASIPAAEVMRPLNDMILVKLQSIPSQTKAGILLPTVFENEDEADEFVAPAMRVGTVVAFGPGRLAEDGTTVPMPPIAAGQQVVVGTGKGERVQLEGQSLQESTHFLFKADEVWFGCD
jgi:co-chaperonin GroES (HSP10)